MRMRLDGTPLTGHHVRLEPLAEEHREGLRFAADDERIWVHTLTNAQGAGFDPWFDGTLAEGAAGTQIPFTVRLLADDRLLGSTSYLDIELKHKRIEIGATWYHPSAWATAVNPECKLLLLAHAFEVLGVNRVALITDARNERSQAAIAKLGAVREGVLRSHKIAQGGRVRDTVVFSIIAAEWPAVREGLWKRLKEFHAAGAVVL
jgi:RimJ/RimL family protein N-acetyltransferase